MAAVETVCSPPPVASDGIEMKCDFVIEQRVDGHVVGAIAMRIDGQREAAVSLWLEPTVRGRGSGTEVLRRCLRMLFVDFGVGSVSVRVATKNRPARHVLAKLGFTAGRLHPDMGDRESHGTEYWTLDALPWRQAHADRPLIVVAAAALIDVDGRVLLAARPPGKSLAGQWEFPGGKLESGETPEGALIRELKEELGIDVSASCLAPLAFASHDYDRFHLLMPLYACRRWVGTPQAREGQRLAWVAMSRFADYPMPPADIPLVAQLRDWL
jgi:8-oxo-dGTP diphosphatase